MRIQTNGNNLNKRLGLEHEFGVDELLKGLIIILWLCLTVVFAENAYGTNIGFIQMDATTEAI